MKCVNFRFAREKQTFFTIEKKYRLYKTAHNTEVCFNSYSFVQLSDIYLSMTEILLSLYIFNWGVTFKHWVKLDS